MLVNHCEDTILTRVYGDVLAIQLNRHKGNLTLRVNWVNKSSLPTASGWVIGNHNTDKWFLRDHNLEWYRLTPARAQTWIHHPISYPKEEHTKVALQQAFTPLCMQRIYQVLPKSQALLTAFCMGRHARLGEASTVRLLCPQIVMNIIESFNFYL